MTETRIISSTVREYVPERDPNTGKFQDRDEFIKNKRNQQHVSCPCKAGSICKNYTDWKNHIKNDTHKNWLKYYSQTELEKKKVEELETENQKLNEFKTRLQKQNRKMRLQLGEEKKMVKQLEEEKEEVEQYLGELSLELVEKEEELKKIKEELKQTKSELDDANEFIDTALDMEEESETNEQYEDCI